MKLMVRSWDSTGPNYNFEEEETRIEYYTIDHGMDGPAEVKIIISDPTGSLAQKYNGVAAAVFGGPGKATIEDPDATDMFFGRITLITSNTTPRTVTLTCLDWLSQLDDEQEDYDMRQDLDPVDDAGVQGLRESFVHADPDGPGYPVVDIGGDSNVYDDNMEWTADIFNGMKFILPATMAGEHTVSIGPYNKTVTPDSGDIDQDDDAPQNLWEEAGQDVTADDDDDYTVDYDFYINVPDSSFLVALTGARVRIRHLFIDPDYPTSTCQVQIDDKDNGYVTIGNLKIPGTVHQNEVFEIPESVLDKITDAGVASVRFNVELGGVHGGSGGALLQLFKLRVEVDVDTTGTSTAYPIIDTAGTDVISTSIVKVTGTLQAGEYIWEGMPYSIAQEIYKHIDSAEDPGDIIDGGDTMEGLTFAGTIEHTSGISTRQYIKKTRLQMLQDLAPQDKANFWIPLGTTTVTWKSTYNDGAPETLTDTDVNEWVVIQDALKVANKHIVQGMRIGDYQLESEYSDATSISYYNATRTRSIKDAGLTSEFDTLARATALTNQYKDAQLIIIATVDGNTAKAAHDKTIVLGDEVSITSTYLGLSGAVYVVQRFEYDSRLPDKTRLTLHPRVSTVGLQTLERQTEQAAMSNMRRGTVDNFVPPNATETI